MNLAPWDSCPDYWTCQSPYCEGPHGEMERRAAAAAWARRMDGFRTLQRIARDHQLDVQIIDPEGEGGDDAPGPVELYPVTGGVVIGGRGTDGTWCTPVELRYPVAPNRPGADQVFAPLLLAEVNEQRRLVANPDSRARYLVSHSVLITVVACCAQQAERQAWAALFHRDASTRIEILETEVMRVPAYRWELPELQKSRPEDGHAASFAMEASRFEVIYYVASMVYAESTDHAEELGHDALLNAAGRLVVEVIPDLTGPAKAGEEVQPTPLELVRFTAQLG